MLLPYTIHRFHMSDKTEEEVQNTLKKIEHINVTGKVSAEVVPVEVYFTFEVLIL